MALRSRGNCGGKWPGASEAPDAIRADPYVGVANPEFAESFLLTNSLRDRDLSWAELLKRTRGVAQPAYSTYPPNTGPLLPPID